MVISISLKSQTQAALWGSPGEEKGDCEKEDGWNVAKRIDSGPNPLVSGLVDCVKITDCSTLSSLVPDCHRRLLLCRSKICRFQNSRVLRLSRSLNHFCSFNTMG